MIVLVKLFLAHLIGDFILQPNSWVQAKEAKKLRAWQLYSHVLIHALLTALLLRRESTWAVIGMLFVTHLVIDTGKILLQNKKNKRLLFFIDQLLHLLSLAIIYITLLHKNRPIDLSWLSSDLRILQLTCIVLLTLPASVTIKTIISTWTPTSQKDNNKKAIADSLQSAGLYIGIIERLFVFAFTVAGHWEVIGFLLAAKSIFRFGDLRSSTERKLTEYVLIGTLLSFGSAMLVATAYKVLAQHMV